MTAAIASVRAIAAVVCRNPKANRSYPAAKWINLVAKRLYARSKRGVSPQQTIAMLGANKPNVSNETINNYS